MFKRAKQYYHLAFSKELVFWESTRKRQDILKCLAVFTRFLDLKNDTEFHYELLKWMKKKDLKWNSTKKHNTYRLTKIIPVESVLERINQLPEKYKIFALFTLVSGLRTSEAITAFNNHDSLCSEGVMELFWDRVTKKANSVYCHPLLHDKMNHHHVSASRVTKNLNSKILGCEIRYLRKLNYTINATKIDPLLAEFMQGRRGNVSQRHYFLPMMSQNQKKWIKIWKTILNNTKNTHENNIAKPIIPNNENPPNHHQA
jgi:intergrase/recombinase